jgi:hypothetical protein
MPPRPPVHGLQGLGYAGGSRPIPMPARGVPLPGEDQRARDAVQRAQRVLTKSTTFPVNNIDERVSYIRRRINEDSLKHEIREAAVMVLSRKCQTRDGVRWCQEPKDYAAEVIALYAAVQEAKSPIALRYVRDHAKVDQFTAANKLIHLRGGDCDDGTILLGSMLLAVGYPIKMRVIQDKSASSWSHIYLLVGIPPGRSSRWIPLDWSVYPFKPAGWEAPGAAEVAATGKPAGMVVKVRDYNV